MRVKEEIKRKQNKKDAKRVCEKLRNNNTEGRERKGKGGDSKI